MPARRAALSAAVLALAAAWLAGPARGQDDPTPDDAKALQKKFQAERDEASAAKPPADALARADETAARAATFLAAGNAKAAARGFRDARWLLPYRPADLPQHVERVLGETRFRHADWVTGISYSPDGRRLASASRDGTVRVWDLGNGRAVATYRGHADTTDPTREANVLKAAGVAFSPDGKSVVSVGGSQVHLWNPDTGELVKVLAKLDKTDKPLKAVAFRPDGKAVAAGGDDLTVRVYEVATGKVLFTSPNPLPGRVEDVAFHPTGKLLAACCSDGTLVVYQPGASNPLALSVGVTDGGAAFGVAFAKEGGGVLTAGEDKKVRLTAGPNPDGAAAGNLATRLREYLGHSEKVFALAVSADGELLVTGGRDRSVRVWEVGSGKAVRAFHGHHADVTAVAVRPDGKQVASAAADGGLRLWDMSPVDDHKSLADAADAVWAVAVSPDGRRVAAAGADRAVRVYDAASGKLEQTLTGHTAAVTSLAFFPDSTRLASAGGDKVVRVWDAAAGKPLKELAGHASAVLALAVSPDGKQVVSGAADRTVKGWPADADKPAWSWAGKSAVCAVAVRAGNKQVAVGTADGNLTVLDVGGGTPRDAGSQNAHAAGVAGVAFDPDGGRLATAGGDGAVRVWTAAENGTLTPLARFEGQIKPGSTSGYSPVSAVAFSPDGRFVASGGADGVVRVWDAVARREVRGLRGHTDWVTAVAFGPDGRLLASAGVDKAARLFELTQQDTAPPPGHASEVRAVAVSPDGAHAATSSTDGTIKVWDLATGKELTTLVRPPDKVYALSFLGNDALVAGGESTTVSGRVQFWTVKPPKLAKVAPTGKVWGLAGSADGRRAAAWTLRSAIGAQASHAFEVYDAAGAQVGRVADSGRQVQCVAFTPDAGWAAAGDGAGAVRVWNLTSGERLGGDWPVFTNGVRDLGLTPDRKFLVAVDEKGLIKVGDVAKREVIGSGTHAGELNGLVVSPTGTHFLTLGADGEVKAWAVDGVKPVRSWKLPSTVWGAAFTPDGKRAVTANGDGTACVLELP